MSTRTAQVQYLDQGIDILQVIGEGGNVLLDIASPAPLAVASQPTYRQIDVEPVLAYAGSTAITGSVAAIRGNTTIASGTTITGGFTYGVQGKATLQGTLNVTSGANALAGIVGQLDLSASTATDTSGLIAAGWFDCGGSAGAAIVSSPSLINIIQLTNTTSAQINSAIKVSADLVYFMDLQEEINNGAWVVTSTGVTTQSKSLKVKVNGTTYYIPLCTGTT